MNTNLVNQLNNVANSIKCKSIYDYCFMTKAIMSTIANITNDEKSFIVTLDYYKESIKFENYLGLEYTTFIKTKVKKRYSGELVDTFKPDKVALINEDNIKDPLFRAALVTIMNIELVQKFSIPDKFDSYDVKRDASNTNLWSVLLDNIIEDGTLDSDTVYWIMIFALLLKEANYDRNVTISKFASDEYKELLDTHIKSIQHYHYLINDIMNKTGITNCCQRFYSFDNIDNYLTNLNHQKKELLSVLKMLDCYKNSKYYNETVSTLYLGIPIFDSVKTDTGYSSVFESRYKWATDASSFKSCISSLAETNAALSDIANETEHYKDFINNINTIFIDNCVKLINNDYSELFSTRTIGAMKRVKYGRSLSKSEIEGFKFITEISDKFEDKKFAKSIKKYYTDTIL